MISRISHIIRIAGLEVMKIYTTSDNKTLGLYEKIDKTPVTTADLLSNQVIVYFLKQLTPDIPIISEEQIPDWKICRRWNYFWLIDPLDGTKEFLLKNGEFTINIAFIRHGEPIMGLIYVPAYNILYASDNYQSWKINNKGELFKISVKSSNRPVVVISRNDIDYHRQKLSTYLNSIKNHVVLNIGSSFKFCLVAEGSAQFYPRFGFTKIWDTAAGHVIAKAAGALVNDWDGYPLSYNKINKNFLNPFFQVSLY